MNNIHTIDLNFQGIPETIGVYLVRHHSGGALVECGPGSTIAAVVQGLAEHQLTPEDITDVFLTHIHLDHAGSAGWWARNGARIHVHSVGAPHMRNPEKLLASASRIYGDQMETLWGEFLAVPDEKIHPVEDGDLIPLDGMELRALDTPGHANHHMSYLLDGVCFSGDVGGVHMKGIPLIRLPSVPPEFNPVVWRQSIQKLKDEQITAFAPTHFGLHLDGAWHLAALEGALDETEAWMEKVMPSDPSREELRQMYANWMDRRSKEAGLTPEMIQKYNLAISSEMSADGIYRYWNKVRNA